MDTVELLYPDGDGSGVYKCNNCRKVYHDHDYAEQCCKCKRCEKIIGGPGKPRSTYCRECWEKRAIEVEQERFEKAEKITKWDAECFYSEWFPENDGFFGDSDEFEDLVEPENVPEYIWPCKKITMERFDVTTLIENSLEQFYEEAHLDIEGEEELQEALDKFIKQNEHIETYYIDYSRAIIIDREEMIANIKELMEEA